MEGSKLVPILSDKANFVNQAGFTSAYPPYEHLSHKDNTDKTSTSNAGMQKSLNGPAQVCNDQPETTAIKLKQMQDD